MSTFDPTNLVNTAKADINAGINTRLDKLTADLKAAIQPAPTPTPSGGYLYDDFKDIYTLKAGDSSPNGRWKGVFFGPNGYAKSDGGGILVTPEATKLDMYGGSALVNSTAKFGNFAFDLDITNKGQTVTESPQQWMCPWVLYWNVNDHHHYYFYIGLQHMEWGKKDAPDSITDQPTIEKYQYIMWTQGPPSPVNTKQHVGVEVIGTRHKIYVNGSLVMDKDDNGTLKDAQGRTVPKSAFNSGMLSLYPEGARGYYQMVRVTPK